MNHRRNKVQEHLFQINHQLVSDEADDIAEILLEHCKFADFW